MAAPKKAPTPEEVFFNADIASDAAFIPNPDAPHVYQAIAAVTAAMAARGIAKDRQNQQQGFKFRGIDDIYQALSRHLATVGLVIIPRVISRNVREVTNAKGTLLFYVTLEAEYDIISAKDGSKHTARIFGEAMDSGDKATNKATSACYKYLCLQTFCIPTEGDNDADNTMHEIDGEAMFRKDLQDAIIKVNAQCLSVDDLSMLKSTLHPQIVNHPEFIAAGKQRYSEITSQKQSQPAAA